MKALMCHAFGPPDTLRVEDVPDPVPGADEVVVRVRAAGVNFPDSLIIQNQYQIKPPLPFSPGGEFAGEVLRLGAKVQGFTVGQRVIAFSGWGGFAEQVSVRQDSLIPMPEGMPFEVAGSFLITYGTCLHALQDRAALRAGETVLVLGAAGGIGLATIEIAKVMGARVIAAASSADKLAVCQAHGADELIDYSHEDLRARLKEITGGRGVDVVCDPVGGSLAEPALRSIAWRGRYLVVGFAGGDIPRIALNLPLLKGCAVVGVFWGDFIRREAAQAAKDMEQLVAWYRSGAIHPLVSRQLTLDQVPAALIDLTQRRVHGKLVVLP